MELFAAVMVWRTRGEIRREVDKTEQASPTDWSSLKHRLQKMSQCISCAADFCVLFCLGKTYNTTCFALAKLVTPIF
jgi:hypothetical protein